MTIHALARAHSFFKRHAQPLNGVVVLAAVMAVAIYFAYEYTLFSPIRTPANQPKVIDRDEALALVALFSLGLMAISWRLLISQRREVALRIAAEQRERTLAHQDTLTGLANRRQFESELREAIVAPPRSGGMHAVLMLDLNDFKLINDIYGHLAGDKVLIHVARRLRQAVRKGDLVARLGGDEFVILARDLKGAEEATTISLKIMLALATPFVAARAKHTVQAAIGISLFPQDGQDDGEIMRKVDIALYRAKAEPGSAFRFFEAEMDARIQEQDLIERELREAIQTGGVAPYFQPLMDLATNEVVGFEALARWTHPTLGVVTPDRFIPVAESCGLINPLTDQLLRQAVKAARQWPDDTYLAFNISALQLKDLTLGARILSILEQGGLSADRLEIELTESAIVQDLQGAKEVLGALRAAGVRIALDDFGTGYSSLYHLRSFKVDKIKIDRSFVENLGRESEAMALVLGLIGLGHGLGLTVTAEGVEHATQANILIAKGCDQAQGYLYSRAIPAGETLRFIETHSSESSCVPVRAARL